MRGGAAGAVELETLVRGLGSRRRWQLFQALFLASMVLMAISCIVVTATSLDALSILLFGQAYGLQLTPHPALVAACADRGGDCGGRPAFAAVADAGGLLVSGGYLLTAAVTAPLAMVDVSDAFQLASYVVSLLCLLQLCGKFTLLALRPREDGLNGGAARAAPALGWDAGLALEVAFWSWCISFAAPLWAEEKDVSVNGQLALAASFSHRAALDLMLGLSGAAAFPHMPPTTLNVLDAVALHPQCGALTRGSGILFVISSLLPNIVDYAMVASRNLECHVGVQAANLVAVGLPFALSPLFYFGASFASLVNALAPLLNGAVQFCVPALLFYAYAKLEADEPAASPAAAAAHLQLRGLRILGISAREGAWRAAALGAAAVIAALVAATYGLNAAVAAGAIRPPRGAAAGGDYDGGGAR